MPIPDPHAQLWRWELQAYLNNGPVTTGHVLPAITNTYDLGSSTYRWRTVYTSDLSLKNGVGDWTIVEGADDLYLYNNKRGKAYKFALIEVDPADAPGKWPGHGD